MNRGELLAILYERLNFKSSPDTTVTTRLGNALNEAQRMILREPGLQRLRETPASLTFASVASQRYYGIIPAVTAIRAITDRTNDRKLEPISRREDRLTDPGVDATGVPAFYVDLGVRAVKLLPAATGLWAVSSNAADTTQTIRTEGILSGGALSGVATATLTGTSRVAIGSLTSYVDVLRIQLSAVAVGIVDIYDAATLGNIVASIPIGYTNSRYLGIELVPTPASAITFYVDGPARVLDMNNATDVPFLAEEFHDLLIHGALLIEYEKQDDPRWQKAQYHYAKGLSDLKHYLSAGPDELPIMGEVRGRGISRFGSNYPAGSGW